MSISYTPALNNWTTHRYNERAGSIGESTPQGIVAAIVSYNPNLVQERTMTASMPGAKVVAPLTDVGVLNPERGDLVLVRKPRMNITGGGKRFNGLYRNVMGQPVEAFVSMAGMLVPDGIKSQAQFNAEYRLIGIAEAPVLLSGPAPQGTGAVSVRGMRTLINGFTPLYPGDNVVFTLPPYDAAGMQKLIERIHQSKHPLDPSRPLLEREEPTMMRELPYGAYQSLLKMPKLEDELRAVYDNPLKEGSNDVTDFAQKEFLYGGLIDYALAQSVENNTSLDAVLPKIVSSPAKAINYITLKAAILAGEDLASLNLSDQVKKKVLLRGMLGADSFYRVYTSLVARRVGRAANIAGPHKEVDLVR